MTRILIPILGFASEGGYRVLSELANAWIRLGHHCTFLVPSTSAEPYFPTIAQVLRCDRKGFFGNTKINKKQRGFDNVASIFAGLQQIGKNYDVIVANHCLTAWPVYLASCETARKIYYVQAYEPDYYPFFKHPFKNILAKWSYLLGLRQIANSSTYRGLGLKPECVIPPGIDLSIFVPKQMDVDFLSKETIKLGTIGRTEPYKGTDTALAAYRRLRKEEPRLRMHVGFGNVTEADDINIVPIKGDTELAAYYRSIDILVVSCFGQHGAPHYPLIEAMASGTPVVQTGYFPGTPDNSWETTDTSVEAVAAAIRQVINSSSEVRSAKAVAAREVVAQTLGWDAVARRFLEHFGE
jgi:glycosyltransferase involved in cell wall biosynthesis